MVMDVDGYLATPETMRRRELEYGVVREPPAPLFGHQAALLRLAVALDDHVRQRRLGTIVVAPIDVILDRDRSLVVQPDVIFVSTRRRRIIRFQVWGAPDLVVEVLSPGTEDYDRTSKVSWYREYGVRECWLVDTALGTIDVLTFARGRTARRRADEHTEFRSRVLPGLTLNPAEIFA